MLGRRGVGLACPPIAFGTDRSARTEPSLASVWPFLPPVAVAVAVNRGLMVSMTYSCWLFDRVRNPLQG
jgi:hypothetical protein